ncbi:MAG: FGGY-family carbohydrate kinase [Thermodesulfobacteriota bacterium]
MTERVFLGVDVGTGSVRVGAFSPRGHLRGKAEHPIRIWRPKPEFVEQSSEDIWKATCRAMKACLRSARINPESVKGLSFDATCSLVALGENLSPITLSPSRKENQNVIVWMDHRAIEQAERINQTGHEVLTYVGGRISPEMESPKLLWIKENLKESWKRAKKFMDLADYMVFRASGNDMRSLCTTVCKWTYLGHEGASGNYRSDFFEAIGIPDLFDNGRVPPTAHPMGTVAGGLTKKAAKDLGLIPGTPVGVGIIDAHAGGIGSLGPVLQGATADEDPFRKSIALIAGTSSCHMGVSPTPRFIQGIWGPYYGAMIPGMWLNEGGQSATGSLIDLVIRNNSSYPNIAKAARAKRTDVFTILNRTIEVIKKKDGWTTVRHLHVLPYHHGNRSPRADPYAKGMVSGLTLNETPEGVALLYYATIQAIAYGTRHIIEAMNEKGFEIQNIHMTGGLLKNSLFVQENADVTGCKIVLPKEPEAVLLGSAIIAAVACGEFPDILQGMKAMSHAARVIEPNPSTTTFHDAKYEVFKEMYDFQKKMHHKMEQVLVK